MPPKLKLTYFNIEGAAEKVRLALKLGGLAFEDERIEMSGWQALKPSTPYGQLPLLSIDDQPPVTQSFAMLRYIGRLSNLYPADPVEALAVDEVCGLQEDFARALTPSMYIGMRPHLFGYPENMPEDERKAVQAKLRATLVTEGGDIPRFLGYFDAILAKRGKTSPCKCITLSPHRSSPFALLCRNGILLCPDSDHCGLHHPAHVAPAQERAPRRRPDHHCRLLPEPDRLLQPHDGPAGHQGALRQVTAHHDARLRRERRPQVTWRPPPCRAQPLTKAPRTDR
jgi:glutathione S-transferase